MDSAIFRTTFLAAALGMLAFAAPASLMPEYAPGRLIVRYRSPGSPDAMARELAPLGASLRSVDPALGCVAIAVRDPDATAVVAQSLLRDPNVDWVEPDTVVRAEQLPDDPSLVEQYAVRQVLVDRAWKVSQGDPAVVIAIVDSGIDLDHPDIAPKLVPGINLVDRQSEPDDDFGHGTMVAGIAAASTNNGLGIAGIGYSCSLMPVKVLRKDGSGLTSAVASGIAWAADHGAKIVSLSLGSNTASRALADAVRYARAKGVLVVAAAGNGGASEPFYPAAYSDVLSVGATDRNAQRAGFSNFGDWVDVAAPGLAVLTTAAGGGYAALSGTSASCPQVAGLAGLVWANLGPDAVPGAVERRVLEGCDAAGNWLVSGQVNAANSVDPSLLWEPRLGIKAASLIGGRSVGAVLSIAKAAPAGGAEFQIESSSDSVQAPKSVRIPPGARSRSFVLRTSAVKSVDTVAIRATSGSAAVEARLQIMPAGLRELAVASRRVRTGKRVLATVRLNGPAPVGGVVVRLGSSNDTVLATPESVVVRHGRSYATFSCQARSTGEESEVVLTAELGDVAKTVPVLVVP